MIDNVCIVCGNQKGRNKYTCSLRCWAEYRQNHRACIVCGKEFKASPTDDTVCCSPSCSATHRKQLIAAGKYDASTKKMLAAKAAFEMAHAGERHVNSKWWVIKSPDGVVYECQNLMDFIKSNPELFDGTPRQAFDGFSKIKASAQGKRKHPSYSWKGWTLISWHDDRLGKA